MATQYTPILQLALPVTGELNGTWGDVVNDNITSMVEEAIAGLATISTWTANSHTLTTADGVTDEARCAMLVATTGSGGTALTGAGQIICPDRTKLYVLKNSSSYAVTLKTAAGTGVAVAAGDTAFVFCDGTNVNACVTQIINGHITGNLTVDGNTTLGDASGDTVTINAGTTTFVNANPTLSQGTATRILFLNGSKVIADAAGLTWDGTTMSATRVATSQVNITGQGDLRLEDTTGGEYVALQAPATLSASYTLTLPIDDGVNGQALITDGSGNLSWSTAASGDVYGPASATSTAVALFDGTTGKLIKNSGVTIDGSNNVSGVAALTASGAITLSGATANGVAYLNGSKVLTTGSALTFDGTNLSTTADIKVTGNVTGIKAGSATGGGYFGNSGTTAYAIYYGASHSTEANNGAYYAAEHKFLNVAGSEQMRLTSTGLGIGTSSPGAKLHTYAAGAGQLLMESSLNTGVYARWKRPNREYYLALDINNNGGNDFSLYDATAGAVRWTVDASGNLGLGVTPSASWASASTTSFSYGLLGSLAGRKAGQGVYLSSNVAFNGDPGSSAANGVYLYSDTAAAYSQYGNTHKWFTAPSGTAGNAISFTQAMTLDASGNLLVNTTSAIEKLTVNGSIGINAAQGYVYSSGGSGSSTNSGFLLDGSGSTLRAYTGNTERMRIDSSGNVGIGTSSPATKLNVVSADNAASTDIVRLSSNNGAVSLGFGYDTIRGTVIKFATGGTERGQFDSSGNLLVGTTTQSNNSKLCSSYVYGVSSGGTFTSNSTSSHTAIFFANPNGNVGQIYTSGSSTGYSTSSDYRLKENIQPMQNALDVVAQLNPVTYTWKADGSDGQGFIAHELQAVVPDCVTGEKDAVDEEGKPVYQGIDTSFLVATLTKAIQELKAELDATKAEVAALKGN